MRNTACLRFLILILLPLPGCREKVAFGPGVHDFSFPLAGEYNLYRTSAHQISISPSSFNSTTPVIRPKVVEVAWNSRFILAKRQALKKRGDSPDDRYELPDEGKFDYWILDVRGPTLHGPFDESVFSDQRKALTVPETLHLKDVYAYR